MHKDSTHKHMYLILQVTMHHLSIPLYNLKTDFFFLPPKKKTLYVCTLKLGMNACQISISFFLKQKSRIWFNISSHYSGRKHRMKQKKNKKKVTTLTIFVSNAT